MNNPHRSSNKKNKKKGRNKKSPATATTEYPSNVNTTMTAFHRNNTNGDNQTNVVNRSIGTVLHDNNANQNNAESNNAIDVGPCSILSRIASILWGLCCGFFVWLKELLTRPSQVALLIEEIKELKFEVQGLRSDNNALKAEVKELKKEVKELRNKNQNLSTRVTALENDNESLRLERKALATENALLKITQECQETNNEKAIKQQAEEIAVLKAEVSSLKKKLVLQEDKIKQQEDKIKQQEDKIEKLETDIKEEMVVVTTGELVTFFDELVTAQTLDANSALKREAANVKMLSHKNVDSLYDVSNLRGYRDEKENVIRQNGAARVGDLRFVTPMKQFIKKVSGARQSRCHKVYPSVFEEVKEKVTEEAARFKLREDVKDRNKLTPSKVEAFEGRLRDISNLRLSEGTTGRKFQM